MRMTRKQWRESQAKRLPIRIKAKRPARIKAEPRTWVWLNSALRLPTCQAFTKSEARAEFKRKYRAGDRLEAGAIIAEKTSAGLKVA